MTPYSYRDWGITEAEYKMLCQAIDQGIVTNRQAENERHGFKWGTDTVSSFIGRLDWSHRFITDIHPIRAYICQQEFEAICQEVFNEFPSIARVNFRPMECHFSFRSHSGKSWNGGSVYFDDNGHITGRNWKYSNSYGTNLPITIGERISNKIMSALYNE